MLGVVTAAVFVLASCGGGSPSSSVPAGPAVTTAAPRHTQTGIAAACSKIPLSRVAALVRSAGGSASGLRRSSGGTVRLTRCAFRAPGVNADLGLDAARRAVTRIFNRVTEYAQFSSTTPALRPLPVEGLGDRGVPGGGANWVPAYDQLLSVRGRRAMIATFYVRGASSTQLKRGAIGLTRIAYAALGVGRNQGD
jgi:hypothetical protein